MITTADRYQPLVDAADSLPVLDAMLCVVASNLKAESPLHFKSDREAYDSAARNLWHYAATLGPAEFHRMKYSISYLAPNLI